MLRTTMFKAARPLASQRLFSTSMRAMAGETGGIRSGGEKAGDAFTRRERSSEELYIRKEEREKLLAIKEKLKQQKQHIEELEKHIDEVTKEDGGQGGA